jgi:hypothetical protein
LPEVPQTDRADDRHTAPDRRDLAIHSFACADCGPVKTKVLFQKPRAMTPEIMRQG